MCLQCPLWAANYLIVLNCCHLWYFFIILPSSVLLWALQYSPAPSPSLAKLLGCSMKSPQMHSFLNASFAGCILCWMHPSWPSLHPSQPSLQARSSQSRDLAACSARRGGSAQRPPGSLVAPAHTGHAGGTSGTSGTAGVLLHLSADVQLGQGKETTRVGRTCPGEEGEWEMPQPLSESVQPVAVYLPSTALLWEVLFDRFHQYWYEPKAISYVYRADHSSTCYTQSSACQTQHCFHDCQFLTSTWRGQWRARPLKWYQSCMES